VRPSGPGEGWVSYLHVHHIERDPEGMDEHDMANLTLLCRSCHSWFHQQSTPDDSPVELTEEDQSVLLPQDIEILRYLSENGPTRTGDIVSGLPSDHSVSAVRERLWVLTGLDNLSKAVTGRSSIRTSKPGSGAHRPDRKLRSWPYPGRPQPLLQRMEDEQVRQALERGCDRSDIIDVLGISRRTTFNKQKRACAYGFPVSAFNRGGRPTDSERSERSSVTADTDTGG